MYIIMYVGELFINKTHANGYTLPVDSAVTIFSIEVIFLAQHHCVRV